MNPQLNHKINEKIVYIIAGVEMEANKTASAKTTK